MEGRGGEVYMDASGERDVETVVKSLKVGWDWTALTTTFPLFVNLITIIFTQSLV